METTAEKAVLEVFKWSKIPDALKKFSPKDANPHFARLLRIQGTNIYQWQTRPVRTRDDWVSYGDPIHLHRTIGKVKPACTHCGRVGHTKVNCPELRGR